MPKGAFKNILVVSLSNIGDVVLTLPVINVLKGNYPRADISVVIGEKAALLLQGNSFFKDVFVYKKKATLFSKCAFVSLLRKKKYDLVIDLKNSALPYLVGAGSFNMPSLFRSKTDVHMSQKHLASLSFLRVDYEKRHYFPLYSQSVSSRVFDLCHRAGFGPNRLAQAILLSPGARTTFKSWPAEKYAELTHMIRAAYPERKIILTGSTEETDVAQRVFDAGADGLVNFAGLLTLKELLCLVDMSAMVIANDSAAMHIGQYLDKLCVAIFGPTNATKYGKENERSIVVRSRMHECMPCEDVQCDIGRACMTELEAQDVFNAVKHLLG